MLVASSLPSRHSVRRTKSSARLAQSSRSSRASARAAIAMPRIISAFHEVRILSSRPGRTRCARISRSLARADASSASTSAGVRATRFAISSSGAHTRRCQRPSKFAGPSRPKRGANTANSSALSAAVISARSHA
jgi:hypothetical protein